MSRYPLRVGEGLGGGISIRRCGPESASDVHRLTQLAFAGYGALDPPSGALRETEASVREDLERGGGALAVIGGESVGGLRFEPEGGYLHVRRVAVHPDWQRRGVGTALMAWAREYARRVGLPQVRVGVRLALPGNLRFYEGLGYRRIAEHRHPGYHDVTWIEMALDG